MFIFEGSPGIAASTGIGSWLVLCGATQQVDLLYPFNIRTDQAVCVHQPRFVQLQELVG